MSKARRVIFVVIQFFVFGDDEQLGDVVAAGDVFADTASIPDIPG
jgi:hypothetical protein